MAFDEIKKRNADRQQKMLEQSSTSFFKAPNDGDTFVVRLAPPAQGWDRPVKNPQGEIKVKEHWRFWVIGDFNTNAKKSISDPPLDLTPNDVRKLEIKNTKIWSTPWNAAQRIHEEVAKQHSFLMLQRHGKAQSTSTTYLVLNAQQIDDDDWSNLLPNISKAELKKLQLEETWDLISDEELHRLETLGVRENDQ